MDKLITVLTATYNRKHLLCDLYDSLERQTQKNFEWVIIDDGSTDGTDALVTSWKNASFPIVFRRTDNQGKNRAINMAVTMAVTPYVMIVDSDDFLTDDAIEYMSKRAAIVIDEDDIAGVAALRGVSANEPLGNTMLDELRYFRASNLERMSYNLTPDAAEIYKTEILRKHPFVVWPGEKFTPEEVVWNQIALEGKSLIWYLKVVCIVRYQTDGLTKGVIRLLKDNPMGYAMMYKQRVAINKRFSQRFRSAQMLVAYSLLGKTPWYAFMRTNIFYSLLAMPLGVAIYFRRKWQFSKI